MDEAAIDGENLAVDVAGLVGNQESHRCRDLARRAVAALQHPIQPLSAHVLGVDGLRQRRIDRPGCDGVDADAVGAELVGHDEGEQILAAP